MIEPILNRLRGTGEIFSISLFKVTGTIIYALYLGVLFGLVTQSYGVGIITLIGFLAGESFGWGKWVGSLCYPNRYTEQSKLDIQYLDKEGYSFPYIHYIANSIIKERDNFIWYCRVALFLRGFIWAMFIYIGLLFTNEIVNTFILYINEIVAIPIQYINVVEIALIDYLIVCIIYGLGFPFACYLATLKSFNYKNRFISIVGEWESQEIYYGVIHMLCNIYIIYTILY